MDVCRFLHSWPKQLPSTVRKGQKGAWGWRSGRFSQYRPHNVLTAVDYPQGPMSVGWTELKAKAPALPVPKQQISVGWTELKAKAPALPVPKQQISVGWTELKAKAPALPVPKQQISVGSTELKAEVPALPVPEQELIGRPKVAL
jgi:hypothetical protein